MSDHAMVISKLKPSSTPYQKHRLAYDLKKMDLIHSGKLIGVLCLYQTCLQNKLGLFFRKTSRFYPKSNVKGKPWFTADLKNSKYHADRNRISSESHREWHLVEKSLKKKVK